MRSRTSPLYPPTRLLMALLGFALLVPFACGDGEDGAGEAFEVRGEDLRALDSYAFTTEVSISTPDQEFEVTFDASFESPDRIQGTARASGDLSGELFELLPEAEVITIGGELWTREPGEDWQSADEVDAYFALAALGSPAFFMGFGALPLFELESLQLVSSGGSEEINGVRARPIQLDKPAIIELLGQETIRGFSDAQDNAQRALPDDFLVDAWIAEDGGYPVRISVSMSSEEGEEDAFLQPGPMSVEAQIDITDTEVDVDIQPPETEKTEDDPA